MPSFHQPINCHQNVPVITTEYTEKDFDAIVNLHFSLYQAGLAEKSKLNKMFQFWFAVHRKLNKQGHDNFTENFLLSLPVQDTTVQLDIIEPVYVFFSTCWVADTFIAAMLRVLHFKIESLDKLERGLDK